MEGYRISCFLIIGGLHKFKNLKCTIVDFVKNFVTSRSLGKITEKLRLLMQLSHPRNNLKWLAASPLALKSIRGDVRNLEEPLENQVRQSTGQRDLSVGDPFSVHQEGKIRYFEW